MVDGSHVKKCKKERLVMDDNEWIRALEDSVDNQYPQTSRVLFGLILIYCHPNDPKNLWDTFKEQLAADFIYRRTHNR